MRLLIATIIWFLASCGDIADLNKVPDPTPTPTPTPVEGVTFTGYVQKAFALTVNGVSFSDSENFYTNFIEELVKPAYGDLEDADVTVEGEYGLSKFGTASKVFMAADGDGHLYEAVTDNASKFAVQVDDAALDEIFKARVVMRIGLKIKRPDSVEHFCYILHGIRDGIKVSESAKPVVFSEFKTQLNTYRCEEVDDSAIAIPSFEKKVNASKAPVDAGSPEVTSVPAPRTDAELYSVSCGNASTYLMLKADDDYQPFILRGDTVRDVSRKNYRYHFAHSALGDLVSDSDDSVTFISPTKTVAKGGYGKARWGFVCGAEEIFQATDDYLFIYDIKTFGPNVPPAHTALLKKVRSVAFNGSYWVISGQNLISLISDLSDPFTLSVFQPVDLSSSFLIFKDSFLALITLGNGKITQYPLF
jgi:hypothetical protein